jgi:hypothetical protein
VAVRKPHKEALRALSGGPKEQLEFVLTYNPEALLDAVTFGDQNVYIRKRELKAAVQDTFALIQRKRAEKEKRHGA